MKRGLPHAHILLFIGKNESMSNTAFMDNIISAEIPNKDIDLDYYSAVEEFMIHGPCGHARPKSLFMVKGRCSKYFPKKFVGSLHFDGDGYSIYRRRDNGRIVEKNGIQLDNRFVVSHNRYLLY